MLEHDLYSVRKPKPILNVGYRSTPRQSARPSRQPSVSSEKRFSILHDVGLGSQTESRQFDHWLAKVGAVAVPAQLADRRRGDPAIIFARDQRLVDGAAGGSRRISAPAPDRRTSRKSAARSSAPRRGG